VLVEDHQQTEEKIEGAVQMVLSKNSGFSYFEVFKIRKIHFKENILEL